VDGHTPPPFLEVSKFITTVSWPSLLSPISFVPRPKRACPSPSFTLSPLPFPAASPLYPHFLSSFFQKCLSFRVGLVCIPSDRLQQAPFPAPTILSEIPFVRDIYTLDKNCMPPESSPTLHSRSKAFFTPLCPPPMLMSSIENFKKMSVSSPPLLEPPLAYNTPLFHFFCVFSPLPST